jgi:ectoine hydroxylase-related dioxygenase (phytanoyl-CoA dioxygenase family)
MGVAHAEFRGALSRESRNQYERDGFVCLRTVFSPEEVAELGGEADRLFHRTDLIDSDNIRCRWESFPKSFVTVIVAIDPANAGNGATEVFPGYHQLGCLSPGDGMYHELTPEQVDLSKGVILDLAPGDIAIFSGFTPHRSAPNSSGEWRRLAYLSYNAFSDGRDQRDKHYAEFKDWLMDRYAEYGKTNVFFR